MIERSSSAMPTTAYFLCLLFCGNFILSGKSADICPKNPLTPTNSVSGMVVATIVGTEKLVDGITSFIYYLGENSVNQVIGMTSGLGDFISKYTIKIQDFGSSLLGSIGGQIQSIYNGSTGSIRVLFDYIIKTENSLQSNVYKQVQSFSDKVVSGQLTGEISGVVKNPIKTISKGLRKAKQVANKLTNNIQSDVKKVVNKVRTSGIPDDVKGIIGAPFRGVKEFVKGTGSVIETVRNETSEKFSGYVSEFQNGGIIEKLVAVSSFPVGITMESWSFTLKISEALKNSISLSVKDVVQPFLGQVLTERLGKIVNIPLDVVEGFYKSAVDSIHQVGGVVTRVTGGGTVGAQINMVVKHPLIIIGNTWNITKQEIKDFSTATIGEDLTEQLASVLSSPGAVISGTISTLTNGTLGSGLKSLFETPLNYLQKIWSRTKLTIRGITKGIIGEKWTGKISDVLNAPGKFISDSISSITGGGSISGQIKEIFTHPLLIINNLISTAKSSIEVLITSITGGGSLTTQISTVLTQPFTLVKNIWSTTKKTLSGVSKAVVGENLTKEIGETFTSPLQKLSNVTASITGGGSITTQLKTVLTAPLDIVKNIWSKTKSTIETATKIFLGEDLKNSIFKIFSSPLQTVSNIYNRLVSAVSGFSANISISAGGEGGGGISGAIRSLIEAPLDIFKGTFRGVQSAAKSLTNGIKGVYNSIPIIGKGSVKVQIKNGNEKSSFHIGGSAKAGSKSNNVKVQGGSKTKE